MNEQGSDMDNNRTELTKLEMELCKQNFQFYDKQRMGFVERFELPMVLNGKPQELINRIIDLVADN